MGFRTVRPTGRERFFEDDEIIVSKTDLQGAITYANEVFIRVSGYSEEELIGAPHSLIRHPEMPRCVFQFLWDTIRARREIFAYVVNLARTGEHYWVLAHVTPSLGPTGEIVGYHSNRRVPSRQAVDQVRPIYAALCAEEARHERKSDQIAASTQLLLATHTVFISATAATISDGTNTLVSAEDMMTLGSEAVDLSVTMRYPNGGTLTISLSGTATAGAATVILTYVDVDRQDEHYKV